MNIFLKLWAAGMCALFACLLPQSLARSHEVDVVAVSHVQAAQALSDLKAVSFSEFSPVDVPAPVQAPSPVSNCGSDAQMAAIYQKESGCSTGAINPGGCEGLGQECGHKYDRDYPYTCNLSDWACQDAWFRGYAVRAYGSIYSAYLFRISHNYW